MVRFYLGEEPLLSNVPTYVLRRKEDLEYTLAHLSELVVKEVHGAGGYGMLIGPAASQEQLSNFRERIIAAPEKYIAQPTLALSACPTFVEAGIAPRHIDLRRFVVRSRCQARARRPNALALREGPGVNSRRRGTKALGVGALTQQAHRRYLYGWRAHRACRKSRVC